MDWLGVTMITIYYGLLIGTFLTIIAAPLVMIILWSALTWTQFFMVYKTCVLSVMLFIFLMAMARS